MKRASTHHAMPVRGYVRVEPLSGQLPPLLLLLLHAGLQADDIAVACPDEQAHLLLYPVPLRLAAAACMHAGGDCFSTHKLGPVGQLSLDMDAHSACSHPGLALT